MYYLLFLIALLTYIIYKKYISHNKNIKLEIENKSNLTTINNINFYDQNHKLILRVPKNPNKNKIILNENEFKKLDFSFYTINYEYIIIYYLYNNNIYKFRITNNISDIIFPLYNKDQYKNYVYINRINKIKLDQNILIDYEKHIIPFLGPNYNFYVELNYFISPKNILDYFNLDYNDNSILELIDKFENSQTFNMNDKLEWNPILKL